MTQERGPFSESRLACDTRHRIAYPNSRPRAIKLFGLGEGGAAIARDIAGRGYAHVEALAAGNGRAAPGADSQGVLRAIASEGSDLERIIEAADMVFVVARDGDGVGLATVIAQLARRHGKLMSGVLIQAVDAAVEPHDATLDALRAASDMLVIVSDAGYVPEMLGALGA